MTRTGFDLDRVDTVARLERQTELLERIAAGTALSDVLAGITTALEELVPGARCSVLLLDAARAMPLLWPPFRDVPTSKTVDDLKRLTEEIMPKVNAA